MKKIILINILILSAIFADNLKVATQNCPIYNNIKHTKNSNNQKLKVGSSYKIIQSQSEQYYITVANINIPNRWVDESCFTKSHKVKETKSNSSKPVSISASVSNNMLLALSWQNAFCETHRRVKECKSTKKRYTDIRFGLHGLWPQPRNNIYCGVPKEDISLDKNHKWNRLQALYLTKETRKELLEIMPGSASYLQRHEWTKHGTCANMSEDEYYSLTIALTKEFNNAKIGQFFRQNIGKKVTLQQIKFKMNESFGRGAGNKVELRCKQGLITELWLHLGTRGDNMTTLLKAGQNIRSRCKSGIIDKAGF